MPNEVFCWLKPGGLLHQDAWRPQVEYWQQKLKDAPEVLELPGSAGRPRASIGRCWKAALSFNDAQYEAMKEVASSCHATPLMLITCALQVSTRPIPWTMGQKACG